MSSIRRYTRKAIRVLQLERLLSIPKGVTSLSRYYERILPTYAPHKAIIYPSTNVRHLLPPSNLSDISYKFYDYRLRCVPEAYVSIFYKGRVFSDRGIIVTSEGFIISDISREFGGKYSIQEQWSPVRKKDLSVTSAVVATDGYNTYYHWIFDILPRLHLIREYDSDNRIQKFIFPPITKRFQTESLEILGFDFGKIYQIRADEMISSPNLVVPSLPSELGTVNPWTCEFLRNAILPGKRAVSNISKKIYLKRGKNTNRSVLNEPELMDFLSGRGFSIVDCNDFTVAEQAYIFNNAETVVAPHGSALTNLVFCESGTKVIELFSSEFVVPCYWILSDLRRLNYSFAISGGKDSDPFLPYYYGRASDYTVDLGMVREFLK